MVSNMQLNCIILNHISGFKNHIYSTGTVTLKAYNYYKQGLNALYSCGT
ncbi:uncharacterized protein ACA1_149780 [Acanthamoeba castellanii str. Neff]|uniref:Uncharacterized protein n=1 Tax=Acanthamoeba castellanii (strain ATCC 30010 / Neff) TaxID=1257118 RepID=L8HC68_ACACF|nr:uncharacterized protein ACA1_149780 [Acanthamoeba castellanii str. Neff]ELR22790.1 hypothetical protein ACA1_149780 [Acanthamoeba castellanii str. Neff]